MNRLSIIVPHGGDPSALEETLVSVLENRPAACEVLVTCREDYHDPYALDDEVRFVRVRKRADWLAMANAGVKSATAPVVHLLHAGATVRRGWCDAALAVMQCNRGIGSLSPMILDAADDRTPPTVGLRYGAGGSRKFVQVSRDESDTNVSRMPITGPICWAGFYRRESLCQVGGWDPRVGPLMADVDLSLSLIRHGLQSRVEPASKIVAPMSHWLRQMHRGQLGSAWQTGFGSELVYRRHHALHVDHAHSRWRHTLAHPLVVMTNIVSQVPSTRALTIALGHLAGRLAGTASASPLEPVTETALGEEAITLSFPATPPTRRAAQRRRAG
ncbi:MAG: glycosyltransferase family 2 protein [Pirellulaceae bacterium]|nr:glycosyltransferase family 2 protein [Planctomycetales bacterium]